ncbi:MAG: hypothetical protein KatS3mg055_0793 [Chloroflexus sp.]|nr:MAG: hypothetical protein KatS3mg055_0793 [Chloroflexus sp.]
MPESVTSLGALNARSVLLGALAVHRRRKRTVCRHHPTTDVNIEAWCAEHRAHPLDLAQLEAGEVVVIGVGIDVDLLTKARHPDLTATQGQHRIRAVGCMTGEEEGTVRATHRTDKEGIASIAGKAAHLRRVANIIADVPSRSGIEQQIDLHRIVPAMSNPLVRR